MTGNSSTPIIIRIRSKKGLYRIQSLNGNHTIEDLKHAIADLIGSHFSHIKILVGYPPKQISASDSSSLMNVPIRDGEMLTIEEDQSLLSSSSSKLHDPSSKQTVKPIIPNDVKQQPSLALSNASVNKNTDENVRLPLTTMSDRLLRKVVPANNSCLFTSIHFLMQQTGHVDLECHRQMRDLIARAVQADPIEFNEAILGKSNSAYCDWIREASSWGGSIEIMILSKHFKCEMCVVDIRTSRIDRFGEDRAYPVRVFLIYDGIHFDPLYMNKSNGAGVRTKFSTDDDLVTVQALEMAIEAKRSHQFTDVANFKLRCLVCQMPLKGQKEAQSHAEKTGHINFGEMK